MYTIFTREYAVHFSLFFLSFFLIHCTAQELPPALPMQFGNAAPGIKVGGGVKLRILPVGDSITVGWLGDDHNGYRETLRLDLSGK